MHSYAFAVLLLLSSIYVVFLIINSFITARRHARQAAEWGCKPAPHRPHRLPLGLDLVWKMIKADQAQVVPDYVHGVFLEMKATTFTQNLFGDISIATIDPRNVQAILATQFNDFAIGELRRNTFAPMFGNGIFTSDGKSWYVLLDHQQNRREDRD